MRGPRQGQVTGPSQGERERERGHVKRRHKAESIAFVFPAAAAPSAWTRPCPPSQGGQPVLERRERTREARVTLD